MIALGFDPGTARLGYGVIASEPDPTAIDYGDIEWRTHALLASSEHAAYMQCKLDARYKHVLLDEFQDTNPLQWLALEAWFEASAQADSSPTVFLVGDPKQAIYRFRRAEAKLFDAARDWLVSHHAACVLSQDESRRCAQVVLDVVNRLFAAEPAYAEDFNRHGAHDRALPGRVEILPLARRDATQDAVSMAPRGLRDPLTEPFEEDEDLRREAEAAQLVERVREMVARWEIPAGADAGERRPVSYADIIAPVGTTLTLDGQPVTAPRQPIATGYEIVRAKLSPNQEAHLLVASEPVGLHVAGYGNYTSYYYPAGLNLAIIAPPPIQ